MIKIIKNCFMSVLSYFIHTICYTAAIIFLFTAAFKIFKFNPIDIVNNAVMVDESRTVSSSESEPALAQALIDAQSSHEAKIAEESAALAQAEIENAKETARTVSSAYATLYIDRLGVELPIYYGDDSATLKKGPGQYAGSSLPGEGSQILIAGHNTTHFKPLQNIEIGDIIRMVTGYGEFHYQVISTKIASMNDTTTYDLSLDHEQLVLYTCYPFSGPPGKTQRFFVYADLITN